MRTKLQILHIEDSSEDSELIVRLLSDNGFHSDVTRVETRGFLVGTPASPGQPTPLIFQDAATVAGEGLTTPSFGTPLSSTGGLSRERRLEVGLRLTF